jgi:hypothetical protein
MGDCPVDCHVATLSAVTAPTQSTPTAVVNYRESPCLSFGQYRFNISIHTYGTKYRVGQRRGGKVIWRVDRHTRVGVNCLAAL